MFKSYGIINYDDTEGFRLTVEINQDLSDYYRSLIPKYCNVTRPRYSAHITVVNPELETPTRIRYWGDYQDEKIEFLYDPYVFHGRGYYWLDVWCKRLEIIREELNLPNRNYRTVLRPSGYSKVFHCTIGNYEEKEFDMANVRG